MTASVIFTMDNLGDAADLYRGNISQLRKPGENPAFDTGYPALIDMFAHHGVPITYFVEGWSAQQYPAEIENILKHGNTIGMHGWQHERWAELSNTEIEDLAGKATEAIKTRTGTMPDAFRAPGGASTTYTRSLLHELGYSIDASLTEGSQLSRAANDFVCIPYQWIGVDATHWLWNERSCEEVLSLWQQALITAADNNQHLVFIWHPHVMGMKPERLETGDKILQFVLNDPRFETVALATMRDRIRATLRADSQSA